MKITSQAMIKAGIQFFEEMILEAEQLSNKRKRNQKVNKLYLSLRKEQKKLSTHNAA